MMPHVCVLLAAYNGAKYIEEQLDSILNQEGVLVDIYISLDLSDDNSFDIVSKYEMSHQNVYFMNYGERFGSAGQNFFHLLKNVDFSNYEFISFSDQDDIWLPYKLEKSIDQIMNHDADAYSGNVTAFWNNGKEKLIKKDSKQVKYDYLFESAGPGCTFVLRHKLALRLKEVLQNKSSELNSLWLHDWFCYSFSRSNNFSWIIGSEPLMLYRQHDDNEVGASSGLQALWSRAKVILSGDGLDRVIQQSTYLNQDERPLKLIKNDSALSLFKLAFLGYECRRKKTEKVFFSIAVFILAIKKAFK
ncbi:glycosyltransferase [Aliivibrio sp. 1S128]|uniref:glycosyltransferase n=1 Tax=Aliivibrio sp. 1S128 TaxID=1840085 RepID=UPI00080EAD5B|nr:glycosyltransferase [Aliivibrio sp. 1S128]OCH25523.1 glycosyl transferase [Aliivibrio sp. 1S128]